MTWKRKQRFLWDAGLWRPAKPAIILPRPRHFVPGFDIPMAMGAAAAGNPNAFGTLLFTGFNSTQDITDPFDVTIWTDNAETAEQVYVGDLIIAVFGEETSLTVTGVTDNLGNTYTASNAGTDAGTVTGRMFYARVTNPGTLTTVSFDTTASGNNAGGLVAVFAGPFSAASLVDTNPANNTDSSSPHNCPSTGTRAQNIELVVSWGCADANGGSNQALNAMTTGTLARQASVSQGVCDMAIGRTVTSNTTSITHVFTSTDAPGQTVLGTTSFRNG